VKRNHKGFLLIFSIFIFASASLLQKNFVRAQNLVPNPSFEEHHYDSVMSWQHAGNGFYHYETNSGWAHSGSCLINLCDWNYDPTEYLLAKLTSPLVKDKKYRVTAYTMVNPEYLRYIRSDSSQFMGIGFLKNHLDVTSRLYIIKKPEKLLYVHKDTLWHKTEFDYLALGNENYILLGRFYDTTNIPEQKVDTNYQKFQAAIEKLEIEKPQTIKTEIDNISEKYRQIQADSWNISKEKSIRKQEKLIREYKDKMLEQKYEIRDKINEINDQYDAKAEELRKKFNITAFSNFRYTKYRMSFDDISVEPAPEAPPQPEQVIILNNVFFNTAEWILLPASFEELDKYVAYLKEKSNLKVEISGHTDIVGNDADNQLLSENRAKAVMDYFIQKGISPERMTYKGYGKTRPIADNETDEGRAKNRRVEMKIIAE
jgi:outer membrane protein OmpA-like peptidoglycan-associated protein